MNRFNRSEFYPTVVTNGIAEKDMLQNKFRKYVFKNPFTTYTLRYADYMRPDLISLNIYGTQEYWWIILRCNPELEDIWNDFGYSDKSVMVNASSIDPSINSSNDYQIAVDEKEFLYPNAFKVGERINIPDLADIQDFYTFSRSN